MGDYKLPTYGECLEACGGSYKDFDKVMNVMKERWGLIIEMDLFGKEILPLDSDPTLADTDDDGLLDGMAQTNRGGEVIAPKDPEALKADKNKAIWKYHIQATSKASTLPHKLGDWYSWDIGEDDFMSFLAKISPPFTIYEFLSSRFLHTSEAKSLSNILMFRLDNEGTVFHSQTQKEYEESVMSEGSVGFHRIMSSIFDIGTGIILGEDTWSTNETWQKSGGYNKLFDEIFKTFTNGNMDAEQFVFYENNKKYVLWIWRGNYLNLGSGAEMGLYTNYHFNSTLAEMQWDAVEFELPMTLDLYYNSSDDLKTIFNWHPDNDQWWITGFNPEIYDVDKDDMIMVGSVDMSRFSDKAIKSLITYAESEKIDKYLILDGKTLWVMWGEKV